MEEVIDDFIGKFWVNDRVTELDRLASEQHWHFSQRERFSEQSTALKSFRVFHGKRGKRLTGVIHFSMKDLQSDFRIYDYIYYSDGGKKKTTVIEVSCPELDFTPFRIKPRKGLGTFFRFGRNQLQSASGNFSNSHLLETSNPELTEMQIPDSALALISRSPGASLEGNGDVLLFYYNRKLIKVENLLSEHTSVVAILDRMLHDREKEFV